MFNAYSGGLTLSSGMKKLFSLANLWVLIIFVVATGLFLPPLMGNDAPEYATIALRMHRDHDYFNIINRDYDYLDKPHILFWSASLGYTLFGVHDWSYRLISVLVCFAGAWATYRLGRTLYSKAVGRVAAIMFVTTQAILLANHDVRTDSLLTSFVILSIAQFVEFIERQKFRSLLIGAGVLALAVGTKGMIAVLVTGCCLFFYILSKQKWWVLADWRWLAAGVVFITVLSPILYCYFLQFDQHPEKLVNGSYHASGIKFILWDQSFERLAGSQTRGESNPEFFFLHHNFLWSFLPWTFLALAAGLDRIREFFKLGFRAIFEREQLTFLGTFVMFTLMSFSRFKLPHYMNILFPLISIAGAAFLFQKLKEDSLFWKRYFIVTQEIVIIIIVTAALLLNSWIFPLANWAVAFISAIFLLLLIVSFRYGNKKLHQKYWLPALLAILGFNFLLNANFYPQVGQYQAGSSLATKCQQQQIDLRKVYTYTYIFRSFDFYSGVITPQIDSLELIKKVNDREMFYLLVNEREKKKLEAQNLEFHEVIKTPDIPITRLRLNFLLPETRPETRKYAYLLEFNRQDPVSAENAVQISR